MTAVKCSQCGLVNFSTAVVCKRCQFDLQNTPHKFANPSQTNFSPLPSQTQTNHYSAQPSENYNSGKYVRKMIFGAMWAIGGTVLTIGTYSMGGGKFIVFWGAILFGAVDFLSGLSGWLGSKD